MKCLNKIIVFLTILSSFGCQGVDKLNESDKIDLIAQIIKEEKISYLADGFSEIDTDDSTLYYIALFPNQVQKYNRSNSIIDFDKLFDKSDLIEFKKQIDSCDSTLKLSKLLRNSNVTFYSNSDSLQKDEIEYWLTYPLLNRKKNAMIVYLNYYGGLLMGGKSVLIYIKKSGKWIRLSTIMLYIS